MSRPGQHARHERFIVINEGNHETTGQKILCAWEDCPRPGYALYVIKKNEGTPAYPRVVRYAFCSERHMEYWRYSHVENGKLPPGMRNLSLRR